MTAIAVAISTAVVDSPVGPLGLAAEDDALTRVAFLAPGTPADAPGTPVLREAAAQLGAYFAGELEAFDLPLRPVGTDFQREVWTALADIPFGTTTTYGELAARLGRGPRGARAVGLANGANPLAIVLPCHRVIGADGGLTGFGGGLPAKRWLLTHEGALLL
ncbi:methylated-DNA--[protein]-cysteine S-methyltransferase [Conexibacter sp. SYSU D00693]|uniref:methylated-DNA--[protein]-cysteine S-methyltransferase n=1 Tax=Conexibacter sp. SYSU D00693 TaxID=2812560 RepID=UPI00196B3C38|nr:methylated-DNA--[protein]-cysteine S-methyltransferase [Conexibacter sp. SYSU D00693]